jgi:putative transcriptional regulator
MAKERRRAKAAPRVSNAQRLVGFTGTLLLASPDLSDPNFAKTAILIVEHNENGAFGLVVNRPLEVTLRQMAAALKVSWGGGEETLPVFGGGPVMTESIWLLRERAPEEASVSPNARVVEPGLVITSDAEEIRGALEKPGGVFKIFAGYSGWGESQLEAEMAQGSWLVARPSREMIFTRTAGESWNRALTEMGINPNYYVSSSGVH